MKKYFKNFIFIWSWFKTEKLKLFLIIIGTIGISATSVITPIFYKDIIDIANNSSIAKSIKTDELIRIFIFMIIAYFVNQLSWRLASITQAFFDINLKKRLSKYVFEYLNNHSYKFFSDNMSGSIIKKFNRFLGAISSLGYLFSFDLIIFALSLIGSIFVISLQNKYLGLAYVVYIIIFGLTGALLTKKSMIHRKNYNESDSKIGGFVADVISNHFNLLTFASSKKEFDNFSNNLEENIGFQKKFYISMEWLFGSLGTLFIISELIVYFIAIKLWGMDLVTIGTLVLIISYQLELGSKIFNLPFLIRRFSENMSDIEEMKEILDKPHDIVDIPEAKNLDIHKGEIVFEDVSFKYFEGQEEVINKLNLTIKTGERVALVGVSGSGKSTIIKLMLRLFDLTSGKIIIDGQNIAEITQESLRKNISLVPQEPVLFHRSLGENIAYGKDDATLDEIITASKDAQCHKFISHQELGYDTLVGERGIKLSGGERQRVAIARVLLKNAKILLLDEATSALDSESEILIQKAIDKAMKGKTTIAIAHRLSTIMKMDRIVVLEKGKIVEDGSHSELLAKEDGVYKKLWDIQSGGFIGE